jgi:GTP-binding protein
MIVGRSAREDDLTLSVTKKKHLTNHRAASGDDLVHLDAPIAMSLDDAIDYIDDDEFVEVTPKNVRLRKRILDTEERKSHRKARQNGNGASGL